jgi:hypothetical protein
LCWGAGSLAKGHRDYAVPFSFFRKTSGLARETSVRIDLNADVGEAATRSARTVELELLPLVTSVNIACGAHAGDLESMHELVAAASAAEIAKDRGIRIPQASPSLRARPTQCLG